jgi:NAD(P)-dependent dehydrogenase (short-subunit alcohol dehydrogenase family)
MLIERGTFNRQTLAGQVAVVTGGGQGIGYETARALLWLGAQVIIAEIDQQAGQAAGERLAQEFGPEQARFVKTDVGNDESIAALAQIARQDFGQVDIVLNNATLAPLGAVLDAPIEAWDTSYRVNLRGPVLLARAFLPGMCDRGHGVFVCVSSTGQAYMGPYEILKTAQVELANTLEAELEGRGISVFTIGPGFVPTRTALEAVPRLAGYMGIPLDEITQLLDRQTISVEVAGTGFAVAIAQASRYHGQEISSAQALIDAGIEIEVGAASLPPAQAVSFDHLQALEACRRVRTTLVEQSQGWKERSIFERQWMIRTFKKQAQLSVEQWIERLTRLEESLQANDPLQVSDRDLPLPALAGYYGSLAETARGYVKDPVQRAEQVEIVQGWQAEVEILASLLGL